MAYDSANDGKCAFRVRRVNYKFKNIGERHLEESFNVHRLSSALLLAAIT